MTGADALGGALGGVLAAFLDAHTEELVAFRRHLHQRPELSYQEYETTEAVAERLRVAGLEPRVLSSGTGLICEIGSGDGPVVALRADIDALAMDDEKDVPYRSQVPGVAHACGHDVHTTIVLGAGLALARLLDGRAGRVRLLFEPAEESAPGGAVRVIEDGGMDGVAWVFGLHCDPKLDVGRVGVRAGAITSACDLVTVRLQGPGGHTARPQLTVDLVALASDLVLQVPALVRELGDESLNLVFGSIAAGQAANVIPTHAAIAGTCRAPTRPAWDTAPEAVRHAVHAVVEPTGARYEIEYVPGVPPVVNDAAATTHLAAAARAVLGADAVVAAEHSAGGDDFAWYLERAPGAYARLGVHDPASGRRHDLHVGDFDVDERAIPVGVQVLVRAALAALT